MESQSKGIKIDRILLAALVFILSLNAAGCGKEEISQELYLEEVAKLAAIPVLENEIGSASDKVTSTSLSASVQLAIFQSALKTDSEQYPEINRRLASLPGFEDKREEVEAIVGRGKQRQGSVNTVVWHWTWTDSQSGDGVEIARIKGELSYHLCILAENVSDTLARFQYLVDLDQVAYHTSGVNEVSIGISYIGKGPPTQQQEATRRLITLAILESFGLSPAAVKVHRELNATEDIAGVRGMDTEDPDWQTGVDWERRKLTSILKGLHPDLWQRKEGGKWVIPELKDNALSAQEAAAVARMVAENWGIPADIFLPLISSESNFRQWERDGRVVLDYTGDGGTGISQIVSRWHPEVDMERAKKDAGYNLNEAARILSTEFSGNWEEKVLQYKGNRQDFLEFFKKVRDSPPAERETGLPEWIKSSSSGQEEKPAVTINVSLLTPQVLEHGPSGRKVIALTFDGGWADRQGLDTLQALRESGVKCTLFLTGQYIQAGQDLVRQMLEDGHEIGNHSFSHPDFSLLSASQIQKELQDTATAFKQLTGQGMTSWFRFPSGVSSKEALKEVYRQGYQAVGWNLASRDWEEIPPQQIYDDIVSNAQPEAIAVLHLGGKNTASALRLIIPKLREKGYRLVTLSEMFNQ